MLREQKPSGEQPQLCDADAVIKDERNKLYWAASLPLPPPTLSHCVQCELSSHRSLLDFLDIIWLPLITSSTCSVSPWWFKPLWHFSRLSPCSQTAGDPPFPRSLATFLPPSPQILLLSSLCLSSVPPLCLPCSVTHSCSFSLLSQLFPSSLLLPHQFALAPDSPQESSRFGFAPCLCVWTVCTVLGLCH